MRKSRRAILGTACIALVTLLSVPSATAGDARKLLPLTPAATRILVAVDVDHFRGSKLFGEAVGLIRKGNEKKLQEFRTKTRIDLEKQLSTVVIAIPADFQAAKNMAVLAEVRRMNRTKLHRLAEALKGKDETVQKRSHRGVTYLAVGKDGGVALIGKTLVVATTPGMKSVIDAHRDKSLSVGRVRAAMFHGRIRANTDTWFYVSLTPPMQAKLGAPFNTIRTLAGSVTLSSGLDLEMQLVATSQKAGGELMGLVEKFRANAEKDQQLQALGLVRVIKKLSLGRNSEKLSLSLLLAESDLAILKGIAAKLF